MHAVPHTDHPDREAWVRTQELWGRRHVHMSAGHGFAGSLFPVIRGARWLDDHVVADFDARAFETLDTAALRGAGLII
jgi:hypothetical protein